MAESPALTAVAERRPAAAVHGRRRWAWLSAWIAAGALIRLALLTAPGSPDVDTWKIWAFAASADAQAVYGVGGHPPERRLLHWQGLTATVDYPPLAIDELGVAGRVYRGIDPLFHDSPVLTWIVKAPGLTAEVLFVAVMLTWGSTVCGAAAADWIAVAFWLNPAILIDGAGLAYLDAQMAVPAVLAFVATAAGQWLLAGALTAVAVLTKAQAVFVVPVLLLAAIVPDRRGARRRVLQLASGGAAASAAILVPVAARGAWPNFIQAVGRLAAHDMLSGNALNVWWIVTWLLRSIAALGGGWWAAFTQPVRILAISRVIALGSPDPKPIGAAMVCACLLWALWRARRGLSAAGWLFVGSWCVAAYAMFNTQVHENHAYLAVPLLVAAAGLDRRYRPMCWAMSAMVAFNLYVFYGFGADWSPTIDRRWTMVDLTVVASFINVGLFGWMSRRLWQLTRGGVRVLPT